MTETEKTGDFIRDAREELADMIRDGMKHPSTRPVLTWGALGAVVGAVLPVVTLALGLAAGAGYKFYKRIRP